MFGYCSYKSRLSIVFCGVFLDLSSYKAEDVLNEGSLLTPDEIKTIQHSVYVEIAADIGKRDFTPDQKATLEAWAHVAKNGDASQMSTDLIKDLGAVCRGLSAEDIGKLNFADDDTIQGCSQQKGFSKEQVLVRAGFLCFNSNVECNTVGLPVL